MHAKPSIENMQGPRQRDYGKGQRSEGQTKYEKRTYDPHVPFSKASLSSVQSLTMCAIFGLSGLS